MEAQWAYCTEPLEGQGCSSVDPTGLPVGARAPRVVLAVPSHVASPPALWTQWGLRACQASGQAGWVNPDSVPHPNGQCMRPSANPRRSGARGLGAVGSLPLRLFRLPAEQGPAGAWGGAGTGRWGTGRREGKGRRAGWLPRVLL